MGLVTNEIEEQVRVWGKRWRMRLKHGGEGWGIWKILLVTVRK